MTTVVGNPTAASYAEAKPSLFLLDPSANAKFVAGKAKRIGSSRVMLLLAFISFIVAAGMIGYAVYGELNFQALEREGTTTNAVVVDGHTTRSSRGGTSYYITYELTVNKQPYRHEVNISSSLYNRLRIGSTVSVRYLMRDPSISMLWGDDFDSTSITGQRLIGVIVGGTSLVCCLVCVWVDWRNRRISKGTLLRGTLLSASGRNGSKGAYIVTVEYTFTTPSGGIITKKASNDRRDLRKAALPPYGTPVAVLYLDDRNVRLM
jgi:hypothetical protein